MRISTFFAEDYLLIEESCQLKKEVVCKKIKITEKSKCS